MAPTSNKTWTVEGKDGFESLKLNEKGSVPELGEHDVLVRFHYASLNYRDLAVPKVSNARPQHPPFENPSDGLKLTAFHRECTHSRNETVSSPPLMAQAQSKQLDHV